MVEPHRTAAARQRAVLVLAAVFVLAGCGRREERAFFDAKTLAAPHSTVVATPLGPSALRVRWGDVAAPREARASTTMPLVVTFTNEADESWPDPLSASPARPDGRYAVRLGYSWRSKADGQTQRSGDRVDLPHALKPGDTITLPIVIRVPERTGSYELHVELLQEFYFWFSDYGEPTLTLQIEVRPGFGATE